MITPPSFGFVKRRDIDFSGLILPLFLHLLLFLNPAPVVAGTASTVSDNGLRLEARSSATSYHVAIDGDDENPGTLSNPWRTIQKSATHAIAGSTVYIHCGRYFETISIQVSGTPNNFITWQNYNDEEVIVDGGQAGGDTLLEISNRAYLKIKGLHLSNFIGNDRDGIRIDNGSSHIEFSYCKISNIHFSNNPEDPTNENTNVRPFIVLGSDAVRPCREIAVLHNEIFSCRTGSSEGLSINGNVDGFTVSHNRVRDISNIGIDFIGHEETSSEPSNDQARNGICSHNTVYNCQSPYATAAGIYVDGGRDIVIENNLVHDCQWGIEIGCEHSNKSAYRITVRNNLIYNNRAAAIACGGYNYPTSSGTVTNCLISNNTCYHNDLDQDWNGELNFSHAGSCRVINNIFVADGDNLLLVMTTPDNLGNTFDYNLWYGSDPGEESFFVDINDNQYYSLTAYQTASKQDVHALDRDPLLVAPGAPDHDYHLNSDSPCIDAGTDAGAPTDDLDGNLRPADGGYDLGAYEYQVPGGDYNYYLPYYSSANNNWTGLGLINRNQKNSTPLQIAVYDSNGNLLATENKTIPAYGQDAFPVASQLIDSGWMQVNSQQPVSGLAFLGSGGTPSLMADIPFISELSPCLVIPHIAQDNTWDTTILICNPNPEAASITLKYVDKTGIEQGSQDYFIMAHGSGEYLLSTVFSDKIPLAGRVEIGSSKEIAAFALYNNQKSGGTYYAGIDADSCD